MSNVVKLASAKGAKKESMLKSMIKWKDMLDEQGDKLMDRLQDQIRLTDEEAADNNIPEEFSDCSTLAVLTRFIVVFVSDRSVLSPDALITFLKYQIDLEMKELRKEKE